MGSRSQELLQRMHLLDHKLSIEVRIEYTFMHISICDSFIEIQAIISNRNYG